MAGTSTSGKPRTFSYEEARRLRWVEGMPTWWIAEQLGVSVWSVRRALSSKRRAYEQRHGRARRGRAEVG